MSSYRSFHHFPKAQGLYDPQLEKDSCGVGMIASLKRTPSRRVVLQANEMLVRMSHRGACGFDPDSGDGAGMLVALPHSFYQKQTPFILPPAGEYAMGNVFFGKESTGVEIEACQSIMSDVAQRMGYSVLGWRKVPVENGALGETSRASEPAIEQVFVQKADGKSNDDFEKDLLLMRNLVTSDVAKADLSEFYICSLSNRTVTYKGQLTPEQLYGYYTDLGDSDFTSYVALVHSRFSTNTFPSWDRAQPNRIMCHNGEINTLRGNKNAMFSRSGLAHSPYFKTSTSDIFPACSDNMSDSGNFDSVLEVLTKAGDKSLPEAMMAMVPEAWQNNPQMSESKRAMYEYHSCTMEPWDGPAMMAFTDGNTIGATLDRNGLRPSRYYVTQDDHVILSSEVGVLPDLTDQDIKCKGRLEPGKMFLVDFDQQRIISDHEVKEGIATQRPYGEWLKSNKMSLQRLESEFGGIPFVPMDAKTRRKKLESTNRRLNMFGYTTETMDMLLLPMAIHGKEPLGSMGNDAALAVLSTQPKLPFEYFKQLFAQVTNPPIDPIREDLVMSLKCPVGPEANVLESTSLHARRLDLEHPILSLSQMQALKKNVHPDWKSRTLNSTFPAHSSPAALVEAINTLCEKASTAIEVDKVPVLILSDIMAGPGRYPIPSLLALGAVHQHLLRTKQRSKVALFLECGDAKEVHDACTLIGFGADGLCPYVAYEALDKMHAEGLIDASLNAGSPRHTKSLTVEEITEQYKDAIGKGMLKVMSKMGISTIHSYKGAQIFEAVGLSDDIINLCFAGTQSRIKGTDFAALYTDIARFHAEGYPAHSTAMPLVQNPGAYHYRNKAESHFNTPASMVALQTAAKSNSRDAYKRYTALSDAQCRKVALRGLLKFKENHRPSIPLEDVEAAADIVKRFNTGAMSLGSISQETHEALAVAMNKLGGRSNTGEGGEDSRRFKDNRRSAIKQVASGRFGVTIDYLTNADQIQIKMAQGAKPGEGGELPGHKVSSYIGSMRHTTPGVGLISPPPHHDIYSIEDLAQLIHDLKCCNTSAELSVKLVSEVGVGVVAAGVAKAKADHITISGHDGGTGASSWTGVKNGGLPWELGVAEAQQTLVLNGLRSRVRIQTDGQLKTGRDVIIAALLGAEEFGFATAPLITLGCIMMRKCHLNTCPVGIATQDPELRKKFKGQPEHVANFFFLMAEEIREYMAQLGFKTMDEMIGHADVLEVDPSALHYKSKGLDLSPMLINAQSLVENSGEGSGGPSDMFKTISQMPDYAPGLDSTVLSNGVTVLPRLDTRFIGEALQALDNQTPVVITSPVTNLDRTVGATLSHEVAKRYGAVGLPPHTITLELTGHGGQSLGCGLAAGIDIHLTGDANDYVGKMLSGGSISITPPRVELQGDVLLGNAVLYGGTSGEAYFAGKAGERFAVRNSGVHAVVEGVGDHGCEYMTGGRVVVLGETGRNFAAGMSGGIAYLFNSTSRESVQSHINGGMVDIESMDCPQERLEVKTMLEKHYSRTKSVKAQEMLADWENAMASCIKIMPRDYKRVLMEKQDADREAVFA